MAAQAEKSNSFENLISWCNLTDAYNVLQDPWENGTIDLRSSSEYAASHIPFTPNIPISSVDDASKSNITESLVLKSIAASNAIKKSFPRSNLLFIQPTSATTNKTSTSETCDNTLVTSNIVKICEILQNSDLYQKRKYPKQIERIWILSDAYESFLDKYPFLCATNTGNAANSETIVNDVYSIYNYPNEIIENQLFLGDYGHATNLNVIKNLKITHIVNCTPFANHFEKKSKSNEIDTIESKQEAKSDITDSKESNDEEMDEIDIKYYQMALDDTPNDAKTMKRHLNNALEFIETALNSNNKPRNRVLIHCSAGISRSPTVTIAYIMKSNNMTFESALQLVNERRSVAPNHGFIQMLKQFEKEVI